MSKITFKNDYKRVSACYDKHKKTLINTRDSLVAAAEELGCTPFKVFAILGLDRYVDFDELFPKA
jgi:hypothetical protein